MAMERLWALWRRVQALDLRFPCRDEEAAFKKDLQPSLLRFFFVGTTGLVVSSTLIVSKEILTLQAQEDDPLQWSQVEPRTVRLGGAMINIVLFFVGAAVSVLALHCRALRTLDWETIIIGFILVAMQQPILCRPSMYSLGCQLLSDTCVTVDILNSRNLGLEITCILYIDLALTATHLFAPIRSWRGWLVDAIAIAEYTALSLVAARRELHALDFANSINITLGLSVLAMFAVIGGWRNEKYSRANWKARGKLLEQQEHLGQQHEAMAQILSRLCDSLVRLGSNFQIIEPCPSLSALLFCGQIVGQNFCRFIAEESDRERFTAALCNTAAGDQHSTTDGSEHMISISLRDSYRQSINAYAHYACFQAPNGETQYLIGLIEAGERQNAAGEERRAPKPLPLPSLDDEQTISLHVADDGTMTIASMTSELSTLLGASHVGKPADTLVADDEGKDFMDWLNDSLKFARRGALLNKYGCAKLRAVPLHGSAIIYNGHISGYFAIAEGNATVVLKLWPPRRPKEDRSSGSDSHGTPRELGKSNLSDSDSESGGSEPTLRTRFKRKTTKFATVTDVSARASSMLCLLASWNLEMSRKDCCSYHTSMKEGMNTLTKMREKKCSKIYKHRAYDWQCSECGILGFMPEDGACGTCAANIPCDREARA